MGPCGKDSKTFEIKSDDNLIYEALRYGPGYVSKLSKWIQGCDLIEGQWGDVGSIICWTYTNQGKRCTIKEIITTIDETKKMIQYKVIGGEITNAYKSFLLTFQSTNNSATWSIEYEKTNESSPNPRSFLEFIVKITRDIDHNHQAIRRLSSANN